MFLTPRAVVAIHANAKDPVGLVRELFQQCSISEQFQLAAEMMTLAQKNRQAACDHKFFTTVILGAKPGEDNAVDECWKCGKREKIKVALINKEQCIEP